MLGNTKLRLSIYYYFLLRQFLHVIRTALSFGLNELHNDPRFLNLEHLKWVDVWLVILFSELRDRMVKYFGERAFEFSSTDANISDESNRSLCKFLRKYMLCPIWATCDFQ